MTASKMNCPRCGYVSLEQRSSCQQCGYRFPTSEPQKDLPSETEGLSFREKGIAYGLAGVFLGVLAAGIGAVLWIAVWWFSPSKPDPLTPEEERQQAMEERKQAAKLAEFERAQRPLWKTPSDKMTSEILIEEMTKCKMAVVEGSRSPYEMMFDPVEYGSQAASIRAGSRSIEITSQQRVELFNKVEFATWRCNFRGVGFEGFDKEPGSQYGDRYLPG